ncbi:acetate/propionate family kinase [Geodermatophilus ruber]|uniref:Acetate kinase n=1 Tax=Geodermatophilus ruber TaxID=504800 RepID=A0A1I4E1M4_9ACTN|nr:acetate/propionate family kinase [Geodermatophilus ruber]SFK99724.1 acetate kinase [Geodermatophilus ruber]
MRPDAGTTVPAEGSHPCVVLCLNVGSSSLKAAVRDPHLRLHVDVAGLDGTTARVTTTGPHGPAEEEPLPGGWTGALDGVAQALEQHGLWPAVVAHRIVHGSAALRGARHADERLLDQLRRESARDPLHLPRQLSVVEAARIRWSDADQVLVPDSGFHGTLPGEAVTLPVPPEARAAGLRRWGFHGLAVQSVVDLLPGLGAAVVVHLGSGCSVTAVQHGLSRHTTMSLSPAGGVPSLTRSGDLDPEVVLQLVDLHGGSLAAVRDLLNRRSGVAGLSGGTTDVRELLADGGAAADLALRVFVRDVAMAVAGAVTTLEGWDAVVFTGGIGVHSEEIRERVCAALLPLRGGARGLWGSPSQRLVATGVRVLTVPVDEEAVMDRLTRQALSRHARAGAADPAAVQR